MSYSRIPVAGGGGISSAVAHVTVIDAVNLDGFEVLHAAHPASGADIFPGPITNPTVPCALLVEFSDPAYDGGIVTVVGTDQFDQPQSDTFDPVDYFATGEIGRKVFKTITSITKANTGVTAHTATVTGSRTFGIAFDLNERAVQVKGRFIAGTLDYENMEFDCLSGVDRANSSVTPKYMMDPGSPGSFIDVRDNEYDLVVIVMAGTDPLLN